MTVTWFQLSWLHELSQSALAAAVAILGLVILLELRSIKLLRRSMDNSMGRVFEQLDLMRFDHTAADDVPARSSAGSKPSPATVTTMPATAAPAAGNAYAAAAALASTGMRAEEIAQRCGLAAGEARLLASLAAARAGRRADGHS
jgi:hypothetical protein